MAEKGPYTVEGGCGYPFEVRNREGDFVCAVDDGLTAHLLAASWHLRNVLKVTRDTLDGILSSLDRPPHLPYSVRGEIESVVNDIDAALAAAEGVKDG